jgi:hypothetical protein
MSFLGDLGNAISSQFNLGENTTTSLDATIDGQQVKYGSLGDFASQFDQSAERRYLEEGYLRRDPYNTDPKQYEILWQEPSATVLVKKKMFTSIAENFRPDFMDSDEKLYYKAMRILFQNKCNQVQALEKLSKIQQITAAVGQIDNQLVPVIITLADQANNGFGNGGNLFGLFPSGNPFTTQGASNFIKTVDRLRVLYAFNQTNQYTTWITDSTNLYNSIFGQGTGTMEITNFTRLNTTTTTSVGSPGRFDLSISDPYEAMLITDYDIEVALSDATNLFYNSKTFQFGVTGSNQVITDAQNQLAQLRQARNASPIIFKVDPDTLLSKRVTAIIDRLGVEIPFQYNPLGALSLSSASGVTVPDPYLRGSNAPGSSGVGSIAGYDGLDTSGPGTIPGTNVRALFPQTELSVFSTIISTIFQQLTLLANSAGNFTANNKLANYARRKLRFNFSGKLIIQPLDSVHIYMQSKSQWDSKVLAGLTQMFSGFGILQNINNTVTGFKNEFSTLFNPSANIAVQAEKSMFVGADFPNFLWSLVRSQFVTEKEGTHIFGGVVETANNSWGGGKFTVDVSGPDNSFYFRQGKVNFKPGADAFNGLIFDPLTPFKSNFDSVTLNNAPLSGGIPQLLDENVNILSQTGSQSIVKFKAGSLAGQKATQGNYIQDQSIDPATGRLTRVFYAPDGLAYKWKQGIGIFTQNGSISTINDPNLVGVPNIYQQPFAGLDVMNVISLLITGTPYNYYIYFKATSDLFGANPDPQSKQSSSYNFIKSLRGTLSKTNTLWGNFLPYKNLVMNESAIAQILQSQMTITQSNADLDGKLQQLDDLGKSVVGLGAINVFSQQLPSDVAASTQSKFKDLQAQITNVTNSITASITQYQSATKQLFNQVNNDPSYNTSTVGMSTAKNDPSNNKARKELRKQTNYLTRRMSYDVRGNTDKNLFIVDDYYDVDYDIAAFNKALASGIQLYSTEYPDVSTQIMQVADLLNLEVFCDSQGHIRCRPPQYNRMPSSVFYRMIYLKQTLGVQIFPQFLNSLFTDQLTTLRQQIEIIEDEIRLDCAILGNYPSLDMNGDDTASAFIKQAGVTAGSGATFNFISNSADVICDISLLIPAANQDAGGPSGAVGQALTDYANIKAAGTQTKQLFTNSEKYSLLSQTLQAQINAQLGKSNTSTTAVPSVTIFTQSQVQALIARIYAKSGQQILSKDYLTQAGPNQAIQLDTGQTIDVFKVINELTGYLQQWQQACKLFYHTLKNAAEYKSLDDDATTANQLLNPGLFNNSNIPEVYEHMLEDETYDDYGPGSGNRYVIKNGQIRSLRIAERAPDYTTVEVHGTLPFFSETEGGGGPPGFQNFPGGGNGMTTAIAIDYDMWRNYGFKQAYIVNVPFMSDPVSQLGPYAAMLLSRGRYQVLAGSLTISGNEYQQPGEVIYLEDRNLLFYVTSVSHSFDEGANFTTTMELSYGHSIGEYIPTVMDTIGKIIYKNQEISDLIIHRQTSSANEESLGVIQLAPQNPGVQTVNSGAESSQSNNSVTSTNTQVYTNIIYTSKYLINSNNTASNNVMVQVELRIYNDDNNPIDSNLQSQANQLVSQLTNGSGGGPISIPTQNQNTQGGSLPPGTVVVVPVNIDDPMMRQSPSQKALDTARNLAATNTTNQGSPLPSNPILGNDGTNAANITANNLAIRTTLFSYIIDCWITFASVPTSVANSTTTP